MNVAIQRWHLQTDAHVRGAAQSIHLMVTGGTMIMNLQKSVANAEKHSRGQESHLTRGIQGVPNK